MNEEFKEYLWRYFVPEMWYGASTKKWNNIVDDFFDKYETKQLMTKWISVKDRFPEECESVLIYCPGFAVTGAYLVYVTISTRRSPLCWHINDWNESDSTLQWNYVTHWMPLPKPPEGI